MFFCYSVLFIASPADTYLYSSAKEVMFSAAFVCCLLTCISMITQKTAHDKMRSWADLQGGSERWHFVDQ